MTLNGFSLWDYVDLDLEEASYDHRARSTIWKFDYHSKYAYEFNLCDKSVEADSGIPVNMRNISSDTISHLNMLFLKSELYKFISHCKNIYGQDINEQSYSFKLSYSILKDLYYDDDCVEVQYDG